MCLAAFAVVAAGSCATSAERAAAPCVAAADLAVDGGLGEVGVAIAVAALDDRFEPACIEVDGGPVTIIVRNAGRHPHDLTLPDGAGVSVDAGQVALLDTTVTEDGLRFVCTIHTGMDGELTTS